MVSLGQLAHGLRKRDIVISHPKSEKIPPLFAPKAVKHLLGRADGKGRVFFRVKRTKSQKILSSPLKLDELTDQLHDIDSSLDLFFGRLIRVHTVKAETSMGLSVNKKPTGLPGQPQDKSLGRPKGAVSIDGYGDSWAARSEMFSFHHPGWVKSFLANSLTSFP